MFVRHICCTFAHFSKSFFVVTQLIDATVDDNAEARSSKALSPVVVLTALTYGS
jgi:hypothetical protein